MIITSESPVKIGKYCKLHPEMNFKPYEKFVHPVYAREAAYELENTTENYIVYNPIILDYMHNDKVYVINDNLEAVHPSEWDVSAKALKYIYLGEFIINKGTKAGNKREAIKQELLSKCRETGVCGYTNLSEQDIADVIENLRRFGITLTEKDKETLGFTKAISLEENLEDLINSIPDDM